MGEAREPLVRIFGILDISAEVITMLVMIAVVAAVSLIIRHNLKERPGKFQNILELIMMKEIKKIKIMLVLHKNKI